MTSKRVFTLIVGGAALLAASIAVLSVRLWPVVTATVPNLFHAVTYACQAVWQDISQGQLWATGAVTLGYLGISFAIFAIMLQVRRLSRPLGFRQVVSPPALETLAATLGVAGSVHTVQDERPFAVTAGVFLPAIYVSTAALNMLQPAELRAVVEHEVQHLKLREPLRRLTITLSTSWLVWSSLRQKVRDFYVSTSELEADTHVADQHALASAIVRFVAVPLAAHPVGAAASFGALHLRVERLLNPNFRLPGQSLKLYFASLAAVLAIAFAAFIPATHAHALVTMPPALSTHVASCRTAHESLQSHPQGTCSPHAQSTPQSCPMSSH